MLVPSVLLAGLAAALLVADLMAAYGVFGPAERRPSPLLTAGAAPMLMVLLALPVVLIGVVPRFQGLAEQAGAELSGLTRGLLGASDALAGLGVTALVVQGVAASVTLVLGHVLLRRTPRSASVAVGAICGLLGGAITAATVGGVYLFLFELASGIAE